MCFNAICITESRVNKDILGLIVYVMFRNDIIGNGKKLSITREMNKGECISLQWGILPCTYTVELSSVYRG